VQNGEGSRASASGDPAEIFAAALDGAARPRATYRVQLQPGFGFEAAADLVAYFDALGVSDLYTSPFFKAVSGSLHGYDIVDPNCLNHELGSPAAFDDLVARLQARGLGLVLDFVPNHLGVARGENAYWNDVLENGPSSIHAPMFDIDWAPLKSELERKVLLPLLDAPYGTALERGDLRLRFEGGAFEVLLHGARLPLDPRSVPWILSPLLPGLAAELGEAHDAVLELRSILTGLAHLPACKETRREKMIERRREKEILKRRLAALVLESPTVASAVARRIEAMSGHVGDPASFDELDALLEKQAYRLGFFRVAAEEINYRRFFDVNELAAIRVEDPAVFAETHRLLFELVATGTVTGLRVDHPDGLWEPARYFARVQRGVFLDRARLAGAGSALLEELAARYDREAQERPLRPLYIVVEKILSRGEDLPAEWAVHGTTGYDFAAIVGGLFVHAAAEGEMTRIYESFLGRTVDLPALLHDTKRLILETSLPGELNVLAHALNRLSERNRHTRDFTLGTLTAALREVCACFPVYRTYVGEESAQVAPRDRAAIGVAIRLARRRDPTTDASVYDFLRSVLLRELPEGIAEALRGLFFPLVMKLQQLTSAVMAKGVEDTAFYVYNRLVSLNEVGADPDRFGVDPVELHQANQERHARWPRSLLTTSTHDTKRSEDVRARISVLSELPRAWEAALHAMARAARPFKTARDGPSAPDANEEYLIYQTLLGTWPDSESRPPAAYVDRIAAYLRKATKEAKVNTAWVDADPAYDAAVERFVRGILGDSADADAFRAALLPLAKTVAFFGRWGSLAQLVLKLASPGVPDLYQGNELWDDSLVDPDNRRPVDFAARRRLLGELLARQGEGTKLVRELVRTAADGRIKLFVTWAGLTLRRRFPEAFAETSGYTPIFAEGPSRDHVVAFARTGGGTVILAVAARLVAVRLAGRVDPPIGAVWSDTRLLLPAELGIARYRDAITGALIAPVPVGSANGAALALDRVLADLPVALLVGELRARSAVGRSLETVGGPTNEDAVRGPGARGLLPG
jgi:(1->4)-alpha-D-glucan 1-alpha-D-glucosylmutase